VKEYGEIGDPSPGRISGAEGERLVRMAAKKAASKGGTENRESDAKGKAQTGRRGLEFPIWFPAVLYGAVTLLLFRKFVFSGQMLLGQDTLALGFMARNFFAQALRAGVFPLWNPLILGGTPFLDSLAGGDSLYPTSILLVLMEPYRALGWKLILHVFAAGLFTFGWIRALGSSRTAALLCGLAYLLAPFMVTLVYPGHDGKLFVTALTPLLFWATERALAGGRLRAFGGMSLVIALVILTTHFQQAYFLFGAVGVYAAVRVVLLRRSGTPTQTAAGRFGLFLAFSLLGAGVSAIQLIPAVDYVTEYSRRTSTTTRASEAGGVAYSSSWSMHPEEAVSLVVPEFVGNSSGGAGWTTGTYWGRNVFKLNHEYAGLIVLLLAVAAFFGAPAAGIRFTFLGIGGVALLFALGTHTPVWRIFYEVLPGISLFRAPSIAAFLFGFSAVTLMAFGIDRILGLGGSTAPEGPERLREDLPSEEEREGEDRKMRWVLAGVVALLFMGTLLAASGSLTSAWTSVMFGNLDPQKLDALLRAQTFIARGFLIATLLAGGTLALTWAFQRRGMPASVWVLGIGVMVILDLGRVDDPFIQTLDFHAWAGADANIRFLQERMREDPPFRILSMGGNGDGQDVKPGIHGLELAGGHHPNDLARYRELIGMVGSGLPANFFRADGSGLNLSLLSILNVRYVLWPVYRFGGLPDGEPVMATSLGGDEVYEAVYEIPTLPRARLVGEAVVVSDDDAVNYILSPEFRPEAEVVLSRDPPASLGGDSVEGEVRWILHDINRMTLSVESTAPALLVVAENWYPAWRASVNGTEAPVLRANHTLRAVPIPAGESEVELYYDAGGLFRALLVSLISLALVLAAIFLKRPSPRDADGGEGPEAP
jgi:hypothetical protein